MINVEKVKPMTLIVVKKSFEKVILLLFILILLYVCLIEVAVKEQPSESQSKNLKETLQNKRHIMSLISNSNEVEALMHSVNVHYWDYVCGYTVEDLRSHPLFPYLPFRRDTTDSLYLKHTDLQFGARIFGYIHPPMDGFYTFAISSDDSSEFWLSSDADPLNLELLAEVGGITGMINIFQHSYLKRK